ncbi:primosomal replication protein N [Aquabacterium fontiphilum]|jgi:primosomal replication protein N|uniref:primosomal replication protein N n=1 Tax=Aquabacterium fontiphilum TaxID=450365 RepID=UPI001378BF69|nr:primosomal replication protein N [Aquabacterium fontiphilum]NBD21481.1 primosomal replication protein N [Aquabacterium fontiphilum]
MNRVELSAQIIERKVLRYTPAGLPALDLVLAHESTVTEAQQDRKVKLDVKAVALGPVAEQLNRTDIGTSLLVTGFLGAPRNGRGVLLHITALTDIV